VTNNSRLSAPPNAAQFFFPTELVRQPFFFPFSLFHSFVVADLSPVMGNKAFSSAHFSIAQARNKSGPMRICCALPVLATRENANFPSNDGIGIDTQAKSHPNPSSTVKLQQNTETTAIPQSATVTQRRIPRSHTSSTTMQALSPSRTCPLALHQSSLQLIFILIRDPPR